MTLTSPRMPEWTRQWYVNVPSLLNLTVKSVMAPGTGTIWQESKLPSSAVMLCAPPMSLKFQVTRFPARTVTLDGTNFPLLNGFQSGSMLTVTRAVPLVPPPGTHPGRYSRQAPRGITDKKTMAAPPTLQNINFPPSEAAWRPSVLILSPLLKSVNRIQPYRRLRERELSH